MARKSSNAMVIDKVLLSLDDGLSSIKELSPEVSGKKDRNAIEIQKQIISWIENAISTTELLQRYLTAAGRDCFMYDATNHTAKRMSKDDIGRMVSNPEVLIDEN